MDSLHVQWPGSGFRDSEVMSDEKKLPHASDQGDVGLFVVIAHEMSLEPSSGLIVLVPVHASQGEDFPEHWVACSTDFPSSIQGRP